MICREDLIENNVKMSKKIFFPKKNPQKMYTSNIITIFA